MYITPTKLRRGIYCARAENYCDAREMYVRCMYTDATDIRAAPVQRYTICRHFSPRMLPSTNEIDLASRSSLYISHSGCFLFVHVALIKYYVTVTTQQSTEIWKIEIRTRASAHKRRAQIASDGKFEWNPYRALRALCLLSAALRGKHV